MQENRIILCHRIYIVYLEQKYYLLTVERKRHILIGSQKSDGFKYSHIFSTYVHAYTYKALNR